MQDIGRFQPSMKRSLRRFARQIAIPKTVKDFHENLWIFLWKTEVDPDRGTAGAAC